jgi:hypothetical protein
MRTKENSAEAEIDEYLWPLTGATAAVDWASLVDELRIRERLAEILAHVRETHLEPRLRRVGVPSSAPALAQALTENIIAGPEGGPPWAQTLKEPVPRALREEWCQLAARLQALHNRVDRR